MAITLCKKHGRAHFTEVCPHVAAHVDAGRYGSFHRIVMVPSGLLVCSECLAKYGLADFVDNPGLRVGEDFWDFDPDEATYEAFARAYRRFEDRQVLCDECIAAAEVAKARRDGRPDPFPV